MMDDINEEYFQYLYTRFGHHYGTSEDQYRILFKTLNRIEYYWTIPRDENRASDAYALRNEFYNYYIAMNSVRDDAEQIIIPPCAEILTGSCSVLEVLCALAARFENDIAHNDSIGNRETKWFWEMMDNLGFQKYVDRVMTSENSFAVIRKIQDVLDRRYNPNGVGGMFPRINPYVPDQRDLELWYQISGYFSERGAI